MLTRGNSEKKIRVLEPTTSRLLFRMLTRGNSEKKDPSAGTNDFETTFSDVDSGKLGKDFLDAKHFYSCNLFFVVSG